MRYGWGGRSVLCANRRYSQGYSVVLTGVLGWGRRSVLCASRRFFGGTGTGTAAGSATWLDFPRAALSSRMSFSLARTCRRRASRTRAHLLACAPGMSRRRARAVLSGSSSADPSRPRCLRGGLVGRHAWVERCDGLLIVGDPSHRSAAYTWPARFASHYWGRRHACRHFNGRLQRVPFCKRALACMARAVAIATLRLLSSVFALASFVCTHSARAVLNLPSGSSGCPREAARDVRTHDRP